MPKKRSKRRPNAGSIRGSSLRGSVEFSDDRIVNNIEEDEGLLWVQQVQVRPLSQRQPMNQRLKWKKMFQKKIPNTVPDLLTNSIHSASPRAQDMDASNGTDRVDNTTPNQSNRKTLNDLDPENPNNGKSESARSINYFAKTLEIPEGAARESFGEEESDDDSFDDRKQFTVTQIKKHENCCDSFFYGLRQNIDDMVYTPNNWFCRYLNWTFRASFLMVFFTFLVVFMLLTVVFGLLLDVAGRAEPACIIVAGSEFGEFTNRTIADAYGLSWTTFTTVGYGAIYTGTGHDHGPNHECWIVNGLCTTESFIGLLYAGMCAAILFGKIGRVQSHAQVFFSDAICITYGDGHGDHQVRRDFGNSLESTPSASPEKSNVLRTPTLTGDDEDGHRIPCPVLQFQVVNSLCNELGGEIMDAQLKLVAANNKKQSQTDNNVCMALYRKVNLTEYEHPFFSRVWHGRHILDSHSPLLNKFARSMIRKNGGYWPKDWNNPNDIRNALSFSDLIVTITGISNVSASTVHAYKRFKYGDVLVGYEFATTLYMNPGSTRLKVDLSLTNDVIEQEGGGAEPFGGADDEDDSDGKGSWGARSIHIAESQRP